MLLCSLLVAISVSAFGQIQIESSGKTKTNSEYQKEASYINWYNDGYYFKVWDYSCSKYHLFGDAFCVQVYLGQNKNEVVQSGVTLNNWFSNASNGDFIYVTNKNGQQVCIYKFNANIYFSYGTEVNCKAVRVQFGLDMTSALTGGAYKTKAQRDELMANVEFGNHILTGVCSFKKEFLKSIKNFKEDENAVHQTMTSIETDTTPAQNIDTISTPTIDTIAPQINDTLNILNADSIAE